RSLAAAPAPRPRGPWAVEVVLHPADGRPAQRGRAPPRRCDDGDQRRLPHRRSRSGAPWARRVLRDPAVRAAGIPRRHAAARPRDLLAGAGGVGLEALSRGAAHATFVERDARAVGALRVNVETLGVAAQARVERADVGAALERLAREAARFDIVFLDPPYDGDAVTSTLERLGMLALVVADGVVIAQHLTKRPPPTESGRISAVSA